MYVLSCEPKASNISGISDAKFPALHPPKHRGMHDGAICSTNRKILPYNRDSPHTRNGAHLRSLFPIVAPARVAYN